MYPNRTILLLVYLAAAGLTACDPGTEARELKVGEVTVTENPARPPKELIEHFHYPRGRLVLSSVYMAGSFLATPEGALFYETDEPSEQVIQYYAEKIKEQDWTVIQTIDRPAEKLIMAESRFRKIVTVVARGAGPTQIKVYFKRSDSE